MLWCDWVGWVQVGWVFNVHSKMHTQIYLKPLNLHTQLAPSFQLAQSCRNHELKEMHSVAHWPCYSAWDAWHPTTMSKAGETEAKHEDIYYVVYRYTTNQIDFTLFAVSQLSSGPESFFFFAKRDCHERDLCYLGLLFPFCFIFGNAGCFSSGHFLLRLKAFACLSNCSDLKDLTFYSCCPLMWVQGRDMYRFLLRYVVVLPSLLLSFFAFLSLLAFFCLVAVCIFSNFSLFRCLHMPLAFILFCFIDSMLSCSFAFVLYCPTCLSCATMLSCFPAFVLCFFLYYFKF